MKPWLFDLPAVDSATGSIITADGETIVTDIGRSLAGAVVEAHNLAWAEYCSVPIWLIIHDRGDNVDHTHVALIRGHRKEVEAYCAALGGGRTRSEYRAVSQVLKDLDVRDISTISDMWKELKAHEDAIRQASTGAERVRQQLHQVGATP